MDWPAHGRSVPWLDEERTFRAGLQVRHRVGGWVSYCQVARILHDLRPEHPLHLRERCPDVCRGQVHLGKMFARPDVNERLGFAVKEPEVNSGIRTPHVSYSLLRSLLELVVWPINSM